MMRRRDLIQAVAGSAIAWPLVGLAQQAQRPRRIGVLMNLSADDKEGQARQCAVELVALAPDVILAASASTMDPLLLRTRSIPIVFAQVPDPVGSGYVASLARPGGNATGFTQFDFSITGKWLGLLKEIDPDLTRVIVLRDNDSTGVGQFGAIQSAAQSIGIETTPTGVRNTSEIEKAIVEFARVPKSGLVVTGSAPAAVHRDLIITLASRQRLPAIYPFRYFVQSGGLLSYGPTTIDPYKQAAAYVDRILKGEKPADLPVQAPTKYELTVNLRTAKQLGISVPQTLLATADDVIE